MNAIKACIFDLDGVLVDTAQYHFLAWKRLAEKLGIEFTKNDNERLKGVSRMASLDIILSLGRRELPEGERLRLAELKNGWYREYLAELDESALLPGVKDFLLGSKASGLRIAVGSASKSAGEVLESTGIRGLFDAVVDGNAPVPPKPAPDIFLVAAKMLGVRPQESVVFEDAEAGIEAALAGGMAAVGVGSLERLSRANLVIPGFEGVDPAEILRHFASKRSSG